MAVFKMTDPQTWPSNIAPSVVKAKWAAGTPIKKLRVDHGDGTISEFIPSDRRNTARSGGRGGPPPTDRFEDGDEIQVADSDTRTIRHLGVDPRFTRIS